VPDGRDPTEFDDTPTIADGDTSPTAVFVGGAADELAECSSHLRWFAERYGEFGSIQRAEGWEVIAEASRKIIEKVGDMLTFAKLQAAIERRLEKQR
jgi:hypothetical protein